MKILSILLFGLYISQHIYCQDYHKLIEKNKFLDVGLYQQGHICGWADSPPKRYFFDSDTLINEKEYSKLYYYNMIPTWGDGPPYCPPFKVDTIEHLAYFFIREDTINKTVYRCCNGMNDEEELLFDFSLKQGDTLGDYHTIDTIVDIITHDSKIRKKFIISDSPGAEGYFIEGIGGNRGPFIFPEPNFEGQYFTMCIKHNDLNIYGNQCYDFITSISKGKYDSNVRVYPNPANENITIHFNENNGFKEIKIINSLGMQIAVKETNESIISFDMMDYNTGLYLIYVILDNDVTMIHKVIKK